MGSTELGWEQLIWIAGVGWCSSTWQFPFRSWPHGYQGVWSCVRPHGKEDSTQDLVLEVVGGLCIQALLEQFLIELVIIIFLVLWVDGLELQLEGTFVALKAILCFMVARGENEIKENVNAFACLMPLRAVNYHPAIPQICMLLLKRSKSGV